MCSKTPSQEYLYHSVNLIRIQFQVNPWQDKHPEASLISILHLHLHTLNSKILQWSTQQLYQSNMTVNQWLMCLCLWTKLRAAQRVLHLQGTLRSGGLSIQMPTYKPLNCVEGCSAFVPHVVYPACKRKRLAPRVAGCLRCCQVVRLVQLWAWTLRFWHLAGYNNFRNPILIMQMQKERKIY